MDGPARFPPEQVDFMPVEQNPVFTGTGTNTWDHNIRERGYILREDVHATPDEDWSTWNSNIAASDDLIHWTKYDENPILRADAFSGNISSPILVHDGSQYRLYTMHDSVRVFYPAKVN